MKLKSMMAKIFFILLFLFCFGLGTAQDKGHNPYNDGKSAYGNARKIDPIPAPPLPPAPIPIDGGVGFLLVAGLGYGMNRMRKK